MTPTALLNSVAGHLCQNFRQKRMPVAHSHVYRDSRTLLFQQEPKPVRLAEGKLVEGRSPSDQFVMVGHLLDPLPGHRTPAQDVVQKRADLLGSGRPPRNRSAERLDHSCWHDSLRTPDYSLVLWIQLGVNRQGSFIPGFSLFPLSHPARHPVNVPFGHAPPGEQMQQHTCGCLSYTNRHPRSFVSNSSSDVPPSEIVPLCVSAPPQDRDIRIVEGVLLLNKFSIVSGHTLQF